MSVYFAQVGPYVKIGFSRNPERRVRRLFASHTRYTIPPGTPLDLASRRLIRHIPGDLDTEWLIHEALEDFTLGAEWFVDEPEVRDFIATVETRRHYPKVPRPGGPVFTGYDEERDLSPEDYAHLRHVLDTHFAHLAPAPTG